MFYETSPGELLAPYPTTEHHLEEKNDVCLILNKNSYT